MKKSVCILFLVISFVIFAIIHIRFNSDECRVVEVITPLQIVLDNGSEIKLDGVETFDSDYTAKNENLAKKLGISEDEAFITGSFARDWAKNILLQKSVKISQNNIIYNKFDYMARLKNSPYCIKNAEVMNKSAFDKHINSLRKAKFVIADLTSGEIYPVSKINRKKVHDFVVIRKTHLKKVMPENKAYIASSEKYNSLKFEETNIKIILSDMTTKLVPDRSCSSEICKEILGKINSASKTIDMAIYGYSSTPEIETALSNALKRGVKIRLVCDSDKNGGNIYPDTKKILRLISDSKTDISSSEKENSMHNKFYIFDREIIITGSANLSHTDMSGYNTNSIIEIKSKDAAKYYTQEFEQMYGGKFHNDKFSIPNKTLENMKIFFSPQDKTISNGILPIIRNAKNYIYIPTFVITEPRAAKELIAAKNRGVDVKIILDALNASSRHSLHKELRAAGIPVKAENWAGKMHSKSMIVDDEYLIIGSMNFSRSGDSRNDENLVILKNSGAAKFYKKFFLYQWSKIHDKWLNAAPRAEGWDSIGSCTDGIDNNYDGKTDTEDTACKKQ